MQVLSGKHEGRNEPFERSGEHPAAKLQAEASVHSGPSGIRRSPTTAAAGRIFAVALVLFIGMSVSIERAAAQGRAARTLGAGIAGALILNELSKGTGKRKAATARRSKRTTAARAGKPGKPREKEAASARRKTDEGTAAADGMETGGTKPAAGTEAAAAGKGALISSREEIRAAQQHLRFMGYDIAQESGVVDAKTKSAVMQFQDSIGAPVTGDLTVDQLQMLFVKVAGSREGS